FLGRVGIVVRLVRVSARAVGSRAGRCPCSQLLLRATESGRAGTRSGSLRPAAGAARFEPRLLFAGAANAQQTSETASLNCAESTVRESKTRVGGRPRCRASSTGSARSRRGREADTAAMAGPASLCACAAQLLDAAEECFVDDRLVAAADFLAAVTPNADIAAVGGVAEHLADRAGTEQPATRRPLALPVQPFGERAVGVTHAVKRVCLAFSHLDDGAVEPCRRFRLGQVSFL